jgi:VanZ family protein
MATNSGVDPHEARRLLDQADQLSRRVHEQTRWPYITFILALGIATSFGTLGMGLTTGSAFGLTYVGTLVAVFALIVFFAATIQGHSAFASGRRWIIYIACWLATYVSAILVVAIVHGSVVWSGITSGLILAVTLACAAFELRR